MVNVADIRVLVVDDHLLMRKQMERMLKNLGFGNLDEAANVAEALEKLAAQSYGVVFLDWHMPGRGGISLLQQCREDRRFDGTAFVVVSAESEPRFISETFKAGAVAYVIKPATEETLQGAVSKALVWISQHSAK